MLNLGIMELELGTRNSIWLQSQFNGDEDTSKQSTLVTWADSGAFGWWPGARAQAGSANLARVGSQIVSPGWTRIFLPWWASFLGKGRIYTTTINGKSRQQKKNHISCSVTRHSCQATRRGKTRAWEVGTWTPLGLGPVPVSSDLTALCWWATTTRDPLDSTIIRCRGGSLPSASASGVGQPRANHWLGCASVRLAVAWVQPLATLTQY
jgi:hypothetical protein